MPSKDQAMLYRYTGIAELADWLFTGTLRFTDPRTWSDPFEVYSARPRPLDDAARKQPRGELCMYVKSFCRASSSEAMWKMYSPGGHGVRIAIDRKALGKELHDLAERIQCEVKLKDVAYKPGHMLAKAKHPVSAQAMLKEAFQKRTSFSHEHETRVVIVQKHRGERVPPEHWSYEISPGVIRSIYVDPRGPESLVSLCKLLAREHGLKAVTVKKSALYETPDHRKDK